MSSSLQYFEQKVKYSKVLSMSSNVFSDGSYSPSINNALEIVLIKSKRESIREAIMCCLPSR